MEKIYIIEEMNDEKIAKKIVSELFTMPEVDTIELDMENKEIKVVLDKNISSIFIERQIKSCGNFTVSEKK